MIRRKAFTIVEVIIVVAIVGILTAMSLQYYGDVDQSAREAVAKSNLKTVRDAIGEYFKAHMEYPTNLTDLNMNPSPEQLILGNLRNTNAQLVLTVPDTAAGADSNVYLATQTVDVALTSGQTGVGKQFRYIKVSGFSW